MTLRGASRVRLCNFGNAPVHNMERFLAAD